MEKHIKDKIGLLNALDEIKWRGLESVLLMTLLDGSSASQTARVELITKFGPVRELRRETEAYRRIVMELGSAASSTLFPRFVFHETPNKRKAVLIMEPLQGKTLEQVIQDPDLNSKKNVDSMVASTLEALRILSRPLVVVDPRKERRAFVRELEQSLALNLKRAELKVNAVQCDMRFWEFGRVSLAHRDLSVVNIIGGVAGVRFIDPRLAVPHGVRGARYASPVFDLVSLDVSLERKELEAKRRNPEFVLRARKLVTKQIDQLVQFGEVTSELCLLSEAVVRSQYAACRCEYCLAPERKWLYNHMRRTTQQAVDKLI